MFGPKFLLKARAMAVATLLLFGFVSSWNFVLDQSLIGTANQVNISFIIHLLFSSLILEGTPCKEKIECPHRLEA